MTTHHKTVGVAASFALLPLAVWGLLAGRALLRANAGPAPGRAAAAQPHNVVEIPVSVQDLPPEQAEQQLRALGLQTRREYCDQPGYPGGAIIRLEPPAGSTVGRNSEVVLLLTRPPVPPGAGLIGWTTDVGPDAPADVAAKMLDFWRAQGVHITFFVCGAWAYKHPDVLRRMAAEGHHIGNHTYHHPHLTRLPTDRVTAEIRGTEDVIVRLVGLQPMLPRMFRPPYGEEDSRVRSAIASLGYRDVLWDIDPIDWDESRTPERITSVILQRAKARKIVLTHVEPHTLQALPAIFEGLRQRGLTPAPVAAIAGANG